MESIYNDYVMEMARTKKMVSYALDPALLKRLETWIAKQEFPPSRTAVVEMALKDFLDKREVGDAKA